ncbi:MAG: LPS export ABC transporter permease LptG [Gammaproteobacteria bacterium]|nr:LPS export ABC transporter permease LptG [Gammaproteobacteria bacterium]
MKLLDRYIGKTILEFVAYSVLVVMGIELIFVLADEAHDLGEGHYDMFKVLQYGFLTLPRKLYEHFPVIVLLGGLLGMGRLAMHREVIAMQMATVSISRIIKSVLFITLLCMGGVVVIGEWVAPASEAWAQNMRASAKHEGFKAAWDEGAWVRHGNWFIYIQDVLSPDELRHITAYEVNDLFRLKRIRTILSAQHHKKGWHLKQVVDNHFEANRNRVEKSEEQIIEEWIHPDVLEALVVKPSTMSSAALYHYVRYLENNQLDARRFRLAFWNKWVQPFATGVMLLWAMLFVLGPFGRHSLGWKTLAGGIMGFVFLVSNQLLGYVSMIFHLPPFLAAVLPTLVFFIGGCLVLRRIRG